MDDLSKEYVLSFFDKTVSFSGDRAEGVRWTAEGQKMHYESLLDIGDVEGKRVLDYGCGKGDLYAFLKEKNIGVSYSGFDINKNLIALAKSKFPDTDFRVFDIEQEELDEDFDYIFLCGVFNLRIEGIAQTAQSVLSRLFTRCRTGLAVNALSSHNPQSDFELNYMSPEELFGFAVRNLSPWVALRHDRMAYDFTLFVYRKQNAFR